MRPNMNSSKEKDQLSSKKSSLSSSIPNRKSRKKRRSALYKSVQRQPRLTISRNLSHLRSTKRRRESMQERDDMGLTIIMRRLTIAGVTTTSMLILKITIGMISTTLTIP